MASFSFPITIVITAIAYIYISTVFVFIDGWFGFWSSPGIMNAVVFTVVALMCVSNYALAIFTDPGRVPSSFSPDVEDSLNPIHEIKRKGGDLRYCQKCSHYKPPRTHHCRICRRCVLRMDHHCNWMNNCVGHANYKIFFVFVMYAVIACVYSLVLLMGSLTVEAQKDVQQSEGSSKTVYYLEGVRALWRADKGGDVYLHPYDLGAYENLISVFGSNIICWVCPTSRHKGSGLRFRTAYDKTTGASIQN